jgi:hypothetical protein
MGTRMLKKKVDYALALNLVRSGTRSKYREIEREVVLDNHKQRWLTMLMYKTNDVFFGNKYIN